MPASPPAAFPAPAGAAASPGVEAARQRVVRLLTDRYADDSLTVEQLDAQLERMHALRSAEALDAMAREFAAPSHALGSTAPTAPVAAAQMAGAVHHPSYPNFSGYGLDPTSARLAASDRVFAVMTSTKRTGAWVVPPHLRVVCVMSEVVLDLRSAVLPPLCEVEAKVVMGTLTLWLPPGARGTLAVSSFMADVSERRAPLRMPTGPEVRVTGTVVMSEVKLRHEDW